MTKGSFGFIWITLIFVTFFLLNLLSLNFHSLFFQLHFPLDWLYFSAHFAKGTTEWQRQPLKDKTGHVVPSCCLRQAPWRRDRPEPEGIRAVDGHETVSRLNTKHVMSISIKKKKKKQSKKARIRSGVAIRACIRQRQQRRARGVASSEPQPVINHPSCLFLAHRTHLTLILCCAVFFFPLTGTIQFPHMDQYLSILPEKQKGTAP